MTLLKSLRAAWADAKVFLSFAQAQQAKFQNIYRKSPDFNAGDSNLLRRNNLVGLDPFQVESKHFPVTYWLKFHLEVGCCQSCMLDGWYPTMHLILGLLHLISKRIHTDVSEYQIAEKILEKKIKRQCARYLVNWKHSPDHNSTWEEGSKVMLQLSAVVAVFQKPLLPEKSRSFGHQRIPWARTTLKHSGRWSTLTLYSWATRVCVHIVLESKLWSL